MFLFFLCLSEGYAQKQQSLWYEAPAKHWEETLPLGNGRLGAMPEGGIDHENIVLNDITLWSGGPQEADIPDAHLYLDTIQQLLLQDRNIEAQAIMSRHFRSQGPGSGSENGNGPNVPFGTYQILANLGISYQYPSSNKAEIRNYRRKLSLDSALASTSFERGGVHYRREYFSSFDDDVIVIRLSADQLKKINFSLNINRPERFSTKTNRDGLEMTGQLNNGTDGKGMLYQVNVKVRLKGGSMQSSDSTLHINDADEAIIYIAAATDFRNPGFRQEISKTLASALKKPYAAQKAKHVERFQELYHTASLSLGESHEYDKLPTDRRLAAFADNTADRGLPVLYFQYGRYLLISSTRPGVLPPNLQGLWCNTISTPWNGDYHLNINVQMNHWPLNVTNLGALNDPFFELVNRLVASGKKTAKAYYNAPGWVAHMITNVWGYTSPGEDYSWGSFNTGSAWLCQMLWEHYQFTGDKAYLLKLYPILKSSSEFYLHSLIKEPKHNWLVTAPSNSPENSFITPSGETAHVVAGSTIDNQLIRYLFNATRQAAAVLNIDTELQHRLMETAQQLPPNQIGTDGRLMEWLEEYPEAEPKHRHISHLWGLYPGAEITSQTPDLKKAARASLEARGDDGTGWSLAWKMNFWARLKDGNRTLSLFQTLLRPISADRKLNTMQGGGTYINLFCAHPPFQIDGNFGGIAGIAEMLVQSHADQVEFLPALPKEWAEGNFKGLRVRGGGEVSASWKDAQLQTASLSATVDQVFHVRLPNQTETFNIKINGKEQSIPMVDQQVRLDLKNGDLAELIFRASYADSH